MPYAGNGRTIADLTTLHNNIHNFVIAMYLPLEQLQIIKWYYSGNAAQQCLDLFAITFEGRSIPCRQTIFNIVHQFEKDLCLKSCSTCNPREISPEEIEAKERRDVLVCGAIVQDDMKSTRGIGEELGIGDKTVAKALKKGDFRSYKYSETQETFAEDSIRRMEFCETVMEKANADENFI